MLYCLIVCTSLTYAQRTAAVLERRGIPSAVVRTPSEYAVNGCGYSVRIQQRYIEGAGAALEEAGLSPVRIVTGLRSGQTGRGRP